MMTTDRSFALLVSLLCSVGLIAQRPAPGPAQSRSILITGGTVHVGDGRVIEDGAVGFRDGRIDYVGFDYGAKAAYDSVIQVKGQHVYPGFILPDSPLGLLEIEQVRATADQRDIGAMEPEFRAITAFKTDSRVIPTVRSNGILLAQSAPQGLIISGTSSIVQLDAWDNDMALVRADDGVFMTWPAAYQRHGWWAEPGETDQAKKDERSERIESLREFFFKAKAYANEVRPAVTDLRLEAMRGLFNGSRTLYIRADAAKEITEAVLFAGDAGVKRMVIVGGYDAWRVADLLRDNKVDVVLRRLHSLPMRPDDDVDLPYRLPTLLKERGIRFCLGYSGDHEHTGGRNLPFVAGTARAYGLDSESALRAITLDAATVLGIDDRCGSLTVGKDATLFISQGDALDMRTNDVRHAYIQGRRVVLDDHQKQLYRQYLDKLEKGQ